MLRILNIFFLLYVLTAYIQLLFSVKFRYRLFSFSILLCFSLKFQYLFAFFVKFRFSVHQLNFFYFDHQFWPEIFFFKISMFNCVFFLLFLSNIDFYLFFSVKYLFSNVFFSVKFLLTILCFFEKISKEFRG